MGVKDCFHGNDIKNAFDNTFCSIVLSVYLYTIFDMHTLKVSVKIVFFPRISLSCITEILKDKTTFA